MDNNIYFPSLFLNYSNRSELLFQILNFWQTIFISSSHKHLLTLVTSGEGVDSAPPPKMICCFFSQKFYPATYDETLFKFLLYTYEDSHNLFWLKVLSREHVEYVYIAWVENVNFKDCNFRVLRGIFWGVSIKQKLLKIEKYQDIWPFYLI